CTVLVIANALHLMTFIWPICGCSVSCALSPCFGVRLSRYTAVLTISGYSSDGRWLLIISILTFSFTTPPERSPKPFCCCLLRSSLLVSTMRNVILYIVISIWVKFFIIVRRFFFYWFLK
ncbi:uncharacterized protein B0J16DRAFT_331609, partial [Fusarium flagelliforme]|uniref:uncharacterized protein n=1 Tax=Fusarium flagelliforme TaxID=2675880 RepID=UPI001E8E4F6A